MTRRERRYTTSGLLRTYDFFWDGDERLRQVKEGTTTRFSASYDGDGLRVFKSDSWTGSHDYSFALGSVFHDSNLSTVHTPGLAQRQGSTDRFCHSDWVGSTRYLSDSTGNSIPSALRFDAFGHRSAAGAAGRRHPSPLRGGDGGEVNPLGI
jgi:hypothetical protein